MQVKDRDNANMRQLHAIDQPVRESRQEHASKMSAERATTVGILRDSKGRRLERHDELVTHVGGALVVETNGGEKLGSGSRVKLDASHRRRRRA